jgi:hypothetical protein
MKTILYAGALLILLSACNKDQRAVIKLDGKWNVVNALVQGYGETNPDLVYEFEYCKLRHSDFCDFAVHNFETNEVSTGVYTVSDDGRTVALSVSSPFGFTYREYNVIKLSNRRLILEDYTVPTGELARIELKAVRE